MREVSRASFLVFLPLPSAGYHRLWLACIIMPPDCDFVSAVVEFLLGPLANKVPNQNVADGFARPGARPGGYGLLGPGQPGCKSKPKQTLENRWRTYSKCLLINPSHP